AGLQDRCCRCDCFLSALEVGGHPPPAAASGRLDHAGTAQLYKAVANLLLGGCLATARDRETGGSQDLAGDRLPVRHRTVEVQQSGRHVLVEQQRTGVVMQQTDFWGELDAGQSETLAGLHEADHVEDPLVHLVLAPVVTLLQVSDRIERGCDQTLAARPGGLPRGPGLRSAAHLACLRSISVCPCSDTQPTRR